MNNNDSVFIESLYNDATDQLKDVYKEQKKNKDDLLKEIADIMLTYTIVGSIMNLSKKDKDKLSNKFLSLLTGFAKNQGAITNSCTTNILKNTVDNTFEHYSYNANFKDVKKIINNHYKGQHFSSRVWKNEQEVAEHLHSQIQDFLKGKVNVNQIKNNIQETYDNNAYEVRRLVKTEVSRCQNEAFDRFGIETGVKKVKYNATLEACEKCKPFDGVPYDFDKKPYLPRHPFCRCFYEIADDNYKKDVSNTGKDAIIKEKNKTEREMANGQRKSPKITLSNEDKQHLINEIDQIKADRSIFKFRDGFGSGYSDSRDIVFISSNIFPSGDDSLHPRDLMSERAALAHEYYGHRANRNTTSPKGSWQDEFRASYLAAKNCPNLSDEDRMYLILDSIERAKEAGVAIKYNDFMRRILYGH